MKAKQIFLSLIIIALAVVGCVVLGFIIGSALGANTTNETTCQIINGVAKCDDIHSFVYLGAPGWEGGALLGTHLGALAGLIIGIVIIKKKKLLQEKEKFDSIDI